jgi:pyruvate dehydrogenase E1 component
MTSGTQHQPLISDGLPSQLFDLDPAETQEWLESLDAVVDHAGPNRAWYLMLSVLERRNPGATPRSMPW